MIDFRRAILRAYLMSDVGGAVTNAHNENTPSIRFFTGFHGRISFLSLLSSQSPWLANASSHDNNGISEARVQVVRAIERYRNTL